MKRNVLLLLTFALFTVMTVYGQGATTSVAFKNHTHFRNSDPGDVAFNSPSLFHPSHIEAYHYADWHMSGDGTITGYKPYKREKSTRNTAIGLMAGGGAALVIGAALLGDGISYIKKNGGIFNGNNDAASLGRIYEIYFGAAFLVPGIALTIPGGVTYAKATKKMKKLETQWADEHRK